MLDMKLIEDTGQTRIYPLKGQTRTVKISSIPIDQLKYNPQNGRIATYISEYEDYHGELPEDYNDVIENFIVDSNEDRFKKTKANIKLFGQLEPIVVLSNGIIVDGNRRFTVLRRLSKAGAGAEFGYIQAAILEDESYSPKDIKTLELNLQHGREEKVAYNPIDYLVDIFRDLIIQNPTPLFTPEEYATQTDRKTNDIKKDMRIAKLMIEFLEFMNQPFKYHLVRKLKLDGPLREADRILQSKKIDSRRTDEIKEAIFANMLTFDGDLTRFIRDLKRIFEDKNQFEQYLEDFEDSLDDLYDYLNDEETKNEIAESNSINVPYEIREKIIEKTQIEIDGSKLTLAQQKPIGEIQKALRTIGEIDIISVQHMSTKNQNDFIKYLLEIENIANKYKVKLNVD